MGGTDTSTESPPLLTVDYFLTHHGVKGMKWGVRNDAGHEGESAKTSKISKLDDKFEKDANSYKNLAEIHNRAAELYNKNDLDRINNDPKYKGQDFTKNTPLRQQYYAEHQKALVDDLEKAASEKGTNASGTKKYTIHEIDGDTWAVSSIDVKHDDSGSYSLHVTYDKMGQITGIDPVADDLSQSEDFIIDVLAHHGVLGMHWGKHEAGAEGESEKTESPRKVAKEEKAGSKIDKQIAKHKAISADYRKNEVNLRSHLADIKANGKDAASVRVMYKHTINRSEPVFYAIHGRTKASAARRLGRQVKAGVIIQSALANRHDKQAAKLEEAKAKLSHEALDAFITADEEALAAFEHHGILGMKWGKREAEGASDAPKETDSTDSREVSRVKAKVSANGLNSLSNPELKALTNRLNLEKQYSDLTKQPPKKTALDSVLAKTNKAQAVYNQLNSPLAQLALKGIKKAKAAATSDAGKAIASEVLKEA